MLTMDSRWEQKTYSYRAVKVKSSSDYRLFNFRYSLLPRLESNPHKPGLVVSEVRLGSSSFSGESIAGRASLEDVNSRFIIQVALAEHRITQTGREKGPPTPSRPLQASLFAGFHRL